MKSLSSITPPIQKVIIDFFANPEVGEFSITDLIMINLVNRQFKIFVAQIKEVAEKVLADKYTNRLPGHSILYTALLSDILLKLDMIYSK